MSSSRDESKQKKRKINMTPWQEGFVKQCEARGINPSAVAKYAEAYSNGQKAAQRMLAKRAAAAKTAFDSMTPYQQGFAARCHQRGILSEKVASWVMRKKAQEGPDLEARAVADAVAANTSGADSDFDALLAAALEADERGAVENAVAKDVADAYAPRAVRKGWNKMTPHERQMRGLPLEEPKSTLDIIADRLSSAGKSADKAVDTLTHTKAVQAARDFIDQHSPEAIRARAALVGIAPENAPTDANILKHRAQNAVEDASDWLGVQGRRIKGRALDAADKAKQYAKNHPGRTAAIGGGAALTAALLGAYLLSRKKKKKAKK